MSARYWDPEEIASSVKADAGDAGDNPEDLDPMTLASELRTIAAKIDASVRPSRSLVAADIERLLRFADDQYLARNIRATLWQEIQQLVPGAWDMTLGPSSDGLYDTNAHGKGYRAGYVSFAVRPSVWSDAGIIGGLIFQFEYSSDVLRSGSPPEGTDEFDTWAGGGGTQEFSGGVTETGVLNGGYYNKLPGGGVKPAVRPQGGEDDIIQLKTHFGDAEFLVDQMEKVVEWSWVDPTATKNAIVGLIQRVLKAPPAGAKTRNKSRLRQMSPYTSLRKFVEHLRNMGRTDFYYDEVLEVANSMNTVMNTVLQNMPETFTYRSQPAPFPLDGNN